MIRPTVGVAVVVVAVMFASAQADDRTTAQRYFRAGAKAYAAQNFAAAAENFDEAYRASPLPEIAFSGAQAYRRLYRVDANLAHVQRAIELYRAYLDQVKSGGRVGDAADNLGEMERELDKRGGAAAAAASPNLPARTRLGVSVTFTDQATGDAQVVSEIADASGGLAATVTATLDGKPIEPFALIEVEPREHRISVAADGYIPVDKVTVAVAGQASLVEVELRPKPAIVTVATESGARLSVDGRPAATPAHVPLELAAGKHLLTIVRRGREPYGRELTLTRGERLELSAPLTRTGRRRAVPWVLGGAGVLAVGAITTTIVAAVHDGRAVDLRASLDAGDRPPSDGDRYDDEVAARDRNVTATWVLGGAAVAAGTVGVLLFVFDTPAADGVRIVPSVGSSTGVTMAGRF